MKNKITKTQRLALVGLLALAKQQMEKLESTRAGVMELLGETEDCGHCSDAIYDDGCRNADKLLEKLKITVRK